MQEDVVEFPKNRKGRFIWQVVRINKNGKKIIVWSGPNVSWATKYGAKRGFEACRKAMINLDV